MSFRSKALGRNRGAWAATTKYLRGDVVSYAGALYSAKADFTSGTTFDASNWDLLLNAQAGTFTTQTAAYAMAVTDTVVLANGTFVVNLPPTASAVVGRRYIVKNIGTGTITVTPLTGTVDGAASTALTVQYSSMDYVTDGTNWYTV